MSSLPTISIVTPSYNQAQFLEETILSVLKQDYPNLEYIIMDGGSKDGSVDIIRKYEDKLAYWISKPDKGQADAIYRGFKKSTGEILAFINSDDYYLPNIFQSVGNFFRKMPHAELLVGNTIVVDARGQMLYHQLASAASFLKLLYGGCRWICQPSTFWRRSAFFKEGGFDTSLDFCFDYDLFLKFAKRRRPAKIHKFLAARRLHPASKTSTIWQVKEKEDFLLHQKYGRFDRPLLYQHFMKWKYSKEGKLIDELYLFLRKRKLENLLFNIY